MHCTVEHRWQTFHSLHLLRYSFDSDNRSEMQQSSSLKGSVTPERAKMHLQVQNEFSDVELLAGLTTPQSELAANMLSYRLASFYFLCAVPFSSIKNFIQERTKLGANKFTNCLLCVRNSLAWLSKISSQLIQKTYLKHRLRCHNRWKTIPLQRSS